MVGKEARRVRCSAAVRGTRPYPCRTLAPRPYCPDTLGPARRRRLSCRATAQPYSCLVQWQVLRRRLRWYTAQLSTSLRAEAGTANWHSLSVCHCEYPWRALQDWAGLSCWSAAQCSSPGHFINPKRRAEAFDHTCRDQYEPWRHKSLQYHIRNCHSPCAPCLPD